MIIIEHNDLIVFNKLSIDASIEHVNFMNSVIYNNISVGILKTIYYIV